MGFEAAVPQMTTGKKSLCRYIGNPVSKIFFYCSLHETCFLGEKGFVAAVPQMATGTTSQKSSIPIL